LYEEINILRKYYLQKKIIISELEMVLFGEFLSEPGFRRILRIRGCGRIA
jgi:hypothetical protein